MAGTHTITASYSGDSNYAGSSGSLAGGQVINQASTLADGTILVPSSPLSGQSAPVGIIGVNPSTGAQSLISTGGNFSIPEYVREGPNQQLYVADYSAQGTGAIIAVNATTGQQSILASGGNINGPVTLAIVNGFAYVATVGGSSPSLVQVNLSNGQQQLISSGGNFSSPSSVEPGPSGSVYWADEYAFGTGAIFLVNIQTGAQTVVTRGGLLNHMIDMGVDGSGNLIVFNASGSIVKVNPQTGTQTTVSSGGLLSGVDGGTVDVNHGGTIYVSTLASGSTPSRVLAIDPTTGAQRIVASGSNLSLVTGLTVYSVKSSTSAVVSSSVNPAASGQSVTFTATINIVSFGVGTPTGTVQFVVDGVNAGSPVSVTTSGGVTTASFTTSALTVGTHTITASYSGDSNYAGSSGSLAGGQVVNQAITLADGTILVPSSPLSGQSAPVGIIGVNPSTGAQSLISTGGFFSLPEYVREGPNQLLYVADYSAQGTGAIIVVNPTTGQQSILASGGNINGPVTLAIVNGFAYVATVGGSSPSLVQVNLSNGQQQLISSGGNFSSPSSVEPGPSGSVYWADEYAFGTGAIFLVNIQTGAQTVVTRGGLLNHMIDMGVDGSGNLIVFNASGSIVKVNPQTGTQTTVFFRRLAVRRGRRHGGCQPWRHDLCQYAGLRQHAQPCPGYRSHHRRPAHCRLRQQSQPRHRPYRL